MCCELASLLLDWSQKIKPPPRLIDLFGVLRSFLRLVIAIAVTGGLHCVGIGNGHRTGSTFVCGSACTAWFCSFWVRLSLF